MAMRRTTTEQKLAGIVWPMTAPVDGKLEELSAKELWSPRIIL